jgi:hypothetical protein
MNVKGRQSGSTKGHQGVGLFKFLPKEVFIIIIIIIYLIIVTCLF